MYIFIDNICVLVLIIIKGQNILIIIVYPWLKYCVLSYFSQIVDLQSYEKFLNYQVHFIFNLFKVLI